MTFVFQQPGTSPLLDAIENCAADCDLMGGMFAFSTKDGAELFLDLPEIQALLTRGGHIRLTVGVDAITNGETLLYLRERMSASGQGLQVKAYVHPLPGTFHPKYMWFVRGNEVKVMAGSGNLTPSGLGCTPTARQNGNWEAFLVQALDPANSAHFLQSIEDWLTRATDAGHLLEVDDPRSLARGAANSRLRFARPPRDTEETQGGDGIAARNATAVPDAFPPIVPWPLPPGAMPARARGRTSATRTAGAGARGAAQRGARGEAPVAAQAMPSTHQTPHVKPGAFVREVSKNRSGQNDVGIKGLEFFGYQKAKTTTVLLQYVDLGNKVEAPIQRHLFENASDNFRVEMPQIAQLPYVVGPKNKRMIMVAVRLDNRTFRYTIVPVKHPSYATLSGYLDTKSNARTGQMRKAFVEPDELRDSWPQGPRSLFPITMISTEA